MKMKSKKKIAAAVVAIVLIAAVVAVGFFMIKKEREAKSIITAEQIKAMIAENKDTAFDFLNKDISPLKGDIRGFFVAPNSEENAEIVFTQMKPMSPNTVIIEYNEALTDYTKELCQKANDLDIDAVLLFNKNKKTEDVISICDTLGISHILMDIEGEINSGSFSKLHLALNEKGISAGILAKKDDIGVFALKPDYIFLRVSTSDVNLAKTEMESFANKAKKDSVSLYAFIDNSSITKLNSTNLNDIVKLTYYGGGFQGCVFSDRATLAADTGESMTALYSFFEHLSDVKYTALTLDSIALSEDGKTLTVSGKSDPAYSIFTGTNNNIWNETKGKGKDGVFSVAIKLDRGLNRVSIRHKNAVYSYEIDNVRQLMTDSKATINEDKTLMTIEVTALTGASVYASVANSYTVELTPSTQNGEYSLYSAQFEIEKELYNITENDVSFAVKLGDKTKISLCGADHEVSVYNDNGLGRDLLCIVNNNYSEVTPATSDDEKSDPTYTPQLAGAASKVTEILCIDNMPVYVLDCGVKINARDCTLLVGGYVLPKETATLRSVSSEKGDKLSIVGVGASFTRMVISPQEYKKGFMDRTYNVDEFTGEYIDISFYNVSSGTTEAGVTFDGCSAVSNAQWLESEHGAVLRVFLKNKGNLSGIIMEKNDGVITITVKAKPLALSGLVVMLDPGHGGFGAPGATYQNKVYEKDIVLDVAQKAAAILREHGATVYLTRETDESVSLSERNELARQIKPDVFISLHCDGYDDIDQFGTHTFYYTPFSEALAEHIHKENVKAYRNYYYTDTSSKAYEKVDMQHKFFPYMVTRIFECPSVLVELGCITNANDCSFLSDDNGRKILATAVAQGIVNYIVYQ